MAPKESQAANVNSEEKENLKRTCQKFCAKTKIPGNRAIEADVASVAGVVALTANC
ncbi:uncharacterized protein Dyak_GE28219 [Drosophila yakuba]|uniref:Uncharacterized protein n=1 Tax=Drosophila yakuba TaxID=7245 RepID=A0A0R1EF45_DROYA|nr:uncharacterized protein Dyak_GE28219 [Drosophila yakuba]